MPTYGTRNASAQPVSDPCSPPNPPRRRVWRRGTDVPSIAADVPSIAVVARLACGIVFREDRRDPRECLLGRLFFRHSINDVGYRNRPDMLRIHLGEGRIENVEPCRGRTEHPLLHGDRAVRVLGVEPVGIVLDET